MHLGKEGKGDLWFRMHIDVNNKKLVYCLPGCIPCT